MFGSTNYSHHRLPSPFSAGGVSSVSSSGIPSRKTAPGEARHVATQLNITHPNEIATIGRLLQAGRDTPNVPVQHGPYTVTHVLPDNRTILSVHNTLDAQTSCIVWKSGLHGANDYTKGNIKFNLDVGMRVDGNYLRQQGTRPGETSYIHGLLPQGSGIKRGELGSLIHFSRMHPNVDVGDGKVFIRNDGRNFRLSLGSKTLEWPVAGDYRAGKRTFRPSPIQGNFQRVQQALPAPILPAAPSLNHQSPVLVSFTKRELLAKAKPALQKESQRLSTSSHLLGRNKAKAFDHGIAVTEQLMRFNGQEKIEVIQPSPQSRNPAAIFGAPLSATTLNQRPQLSFSSKWMDYSNMHGNSHRPQYQTTFIDFANMRAGGGCFGEHGNVQEEQMVRRCPELALLLSYFNPHGEEGALHTRTSNSPNRNDGKYAHSGSANPLLFTGLQFTLHQDDLHAKGISERRDYNAARAYELAPGAPRSNVAAMAAPELRRTERGQAYSKPLIYDMYENAFSTFKMIKENDQKIGKKSKVVTGLWGAGVFGHNAKISIAVQYLAARMAGIEDIQFTGITPAMEQELKANVIPVVDTLISRKQRESAKNGRPVSAGDILSNLLDYSKTAGWKTQAPQGWN